MRKGRGARRKTARKRRRHPARMAEELRFRQPDASEQAVRVMNRSNRTNAQDGAEDDGLARGPLKTAAELLAPQIQDAHGLGGVEHYTAIVAYLVGCWGEVAHSFPDNPEFLPPYLQWREESVARVREAVA